MIEISESSKNLAKAQRKRLNNLYAPVAVNDKINLAARYWAAEPRSKDDAWLCYLEVFGLDVGSEDSSYCAFISEWLNIQPPRIPRPAKSEAGECGGQGITHLRLFPDFIHDFGAEK